MGKIGRPKSSNGTPVNSRLSEWCYDWIKHDWAAVNAEDCPTGRDYSKVVSFFSRTEVYDQYTKAFSFTSDFAAGLKPLSLRTFRDILRHYMQQERVAERKKMLVVSAKVRFLFPNFSCHEPFSVYCPGTSTPRRQDARGVQFLAGSPEPPPQRDSRVSST
jgi:hypothetical protein